MLTCGVSNIFWTIWEKKQWRVEWNESSGEIDDLVSQRRNGRRLEDTRACGVNEDTARERKDTRNLADRRGIVAKVLFKDVGGDLKRTTYRNAVDDILNNVYVWFPLFLSSHSYVSYVFRTVHATTAITLFR